MFPIIEDWSQEYNETGLPGAGTAARQLTVNGQAAHRMQLTRIRPV
jgi:hypothetical protein